MFFISTFIAYLQIFFASSWLDIVMRLNFGKRNRLYFAFDTCLLLTPFKKVDDVQRSLPIRSEISRFGAVTTSGRGLGVILVTWLQRDAISF